jgi:8-oxo-dGTP pyrophosphatase MutT (NUDIX family)
MAYIEELRQHLGQRPILLVGAAVLITDQHQRLLLLKRSDNGCWGIPGGAMELGESLETTVRRETGEETGLVIGHLKLYHVYSGPELFYEYPNGDQVYNVTVVYETNDFWGEIQIRETEHTTYNFFDLHQIPQPISPPIKMILQQFIAGKPSE